LCERASVAESFVEIPPVARASTTTPRVREPAPRPEISTPPQTPPRKKTATTPQTPLHALAVRTAKTAGRLVDAARASLSGGRAARATKPAAPATEPDDVDLDDLDDLERRFRKLEEEDRSRTR
jgi:hypothetical protein